MCGTGGVCVGGGVCVTHFHYLMDAWESIPSHHHCGDMIPLYGDTILCSIFRPRETPKKQRMRMFKLKGALDNILKFSFCLNFIYQVKIDC